MQTLPQNLQPRLDRELDEGESINWSAQPSYRILKRDTLKSQPFQCLLAFDNNDNPIGFIELTIRSSAEECMTSPVLYPLN